MFRNYFFSTKLKHKLLRSQIIELSGFLKTGIKLENLVICLKMKDFLYLKSSLFVVNVAKESIQSSRIDSAMEQLVK